MPVQDDLVAAFSEKSVTRPVSLGAETTRGYFDRAGTLQKIGDVEISSMSTVLYVRTGSLTLVRNAEILIGALGADSAVGGTRYQINDFEPIADGEITAVAIAGGGQ